MDLNNLLEKLDASIQSLGEPAEMQVTLEGEDSNFRVRWMWCQLNGCCAIKDGNLLEKANDLVKYVKGLVATDSKGVFDAVNKNEGPFAWSFKRPKCPARLPAEGAAE